MSIERARNAIVRGESVEGEVLKLQSELGLPDWTVALGLTIDGFVDKALLEAVRDVSHQSQPADLKRLVKEELWKEMRKRYEGWDPAEVRALSLSVSGVSLSEGSQRLGLEPVELQKLSAKRGFLAERKWITGQVGLLVSDLVTTDVKVEQQLRPIVKRLGRKALEGLESDELTAKEALKAFQELGRLLAQVTGELVEKRQLEVGPTEQFVEIVRAAKQNRGAIEPVKVEWIE
jgi:hypothetical protein